MGEEVRAGERSLFISSAAVQQCSSAAAPYLHGVIIKDAGSERTPQPLRPLILDGSYHAVSHEAVHATAPRGKREGGGREQVGEASVGGGLPKSPLCSEGQLVGELQARAGEGLGTVVRRGAEKAFCLERDVRVGRG